MSSRHLLMAVAAAITVSFACPPASAAMPVRTAGQAGAGDDLQLVQDKASTSTSTSTKKTARTKTSKRTQQEIDQSVESGTVPKRYQGSVPKEYHHLIPWSK